MSKLIEHDNGRRTFFIGKLCVAILVVFSTCARGDGLTSDEITEEIFRSFEVYRSDILSDRSNLSKYFSKEVNEIWLSWLLEEKEAEELLTTQLAIENRASFGLQVKEVYGYKVRPGEGNVMVLSIVYKAASGGEYRTYEIGYVKRFDKWLIRWRKSDITKPGEEYSTR